MTSDGDEQPTSRSSAGEVILIPKLLRLDWVDVMALDPNLSDAAFRVACIIGWHLNKHHGDTFLKQSTIAQIWGKCDRTAWAATKEIERAGYLIIGRREFGVRSDGRKMYGGRGAANSYRPALDRSQLSATDRGQKLAIRCEQFASAGSQNRASTIATNCEPTLAFSSSKKKNPSRARDDEPGATLRAAPVDDPRWHAVKRRLESRLGTDVVVSWFGHVTFRGVSEEVVTLSAPTGFIRSWIDQTYTEPLLAAWHAEMPLVRRVRLIGPDGQFSERSLSSPIQEPVTAPAPASDMLIVQRGSLELATYIAHLRETGREREALDLVNAAEAQGSCAIPKVWASAVRKITASQASDDPDNAGSET
jgi:hypothetical protein